MSFRTFATLIGLSALSALGAHAQQVDRYDSWYRPGQPYVKIAVVDDGIYRVTGQQLQQTGVALTGVDPNRLQLFENGIEIPILLKDETPGTLTPGTSFHFVGRRNRAADELWAYDDQAAWRGSDYYSLYTDTTYYWLTWGDTPGLRYAAATGLAPATPTESYREVLHLEQDGIYYDGDGDDSGNPLYTRGEGFFWKSFSHGTSTNPRQETFTIPLRAPVRSADSLSLHVRLNGQSASRHRLTLEVETTENGQTAFRTFDEVDWAGYQFASLRGTIPQDQLPAGNDLRVRVTSHNEFNGTPNIVLLDWIEASYRRLLQAENNRLSFTTGTAGTSTFALTGFSGSRALVLNPSAGMAFDLAGSEGAFTFTDRVAAPTTYWVVDDGAARAPVALASATPAALTAPPNAVDYLIVTTPALRASAETFAAYRASHDGLRSFIVDVASIFDAYDYGRQTPIAIRRFVHRTQAWSQPPRFLLFWGDALYPDRSRPRAAWEVPSFGNASSDGWFALPLDRPGNWAETLAVGRITARTHEQGLLFLQKLQTYEAAPLAAWQKRMMLLAGGTNNSEQSLLQSHTLRWGDLAASPPTGMDTLRFFKSASAPLDPTFQDSLRAALREGASWLSYFGHSAAQTWEIVSDPPERFDNAHRLPVVLSLGCNTGAFAGARNQSDNLPVLGEQLVTGSLNGSIAHWGSSQRSVVSTSAALANHVNTLVFEDTLRTLGVIFQEAKRRYAVDNRGPIVVKHLLMFNLLGDPATHLVIPERPDLNVAPEHLVFSPVAPAVADSQLTVTVHLENWGLVPVDSFDVVLRHTLPGQSVRSYTKRVPPFPLTIAVPFVVPLDETLVGSNRFEADASGIIGEGDETNNRAVREITVFATGIAVIDPPPFGIVTSTRPRIRVSLSSREPVTHPLVFEIDTTATFDSPYRRSTQVPLTGTVVDWQPEALEDDQTYFWRVRTDDPAGDEHWQTSSFTVRTDLAQTGWLQQGALFEKSTQDPYLLRRNGRWAFNTYRSEVMMTSERGAGVYKGAIFVNGEGYEANRLGFGMVVLDGGTGRIKAHISAPTYDNTFTDPNIARARIDSMLALAGQGDYFFIRTRHLSNRGDPAISEDVKARFRPLGTTAIDTLTYNDMWLLMTRIGFPETTREWVEPANSGNNEFMRDTSITFSYPEGQTTSPAVGPAKRWHSLDWETDRVPGGVGSIRVDVLDAHTDEVLLPDLDAPPETDLSRIDARQHPSIRLRATLTDTTQRTTPQLLRWHVLYDPIPEVAIAREALVLSADTLDEADLLGVIVTVRNLSRVPADTLVLVLTQTDAANREHTVAADTLVGLDPDGSRDFSFTLPTDGFAGSNLLRATVRQPGVVELLAYNNVALRTFYVRQDRTAPEYRVLVEGEALPSDPEPVRNLQDPMLPFVPARPEIEITIRDTNPNKLLQDTTIVSLSLDGRPVPLSSPDVWFDPATDETKNEARIRFRPDLSGQDTTHTFSVRVFDTSGNEAADSPYQVHFRIQSDMEIESLYPYPNPMSSATRFAFRLRGADATLAEDFRIRIFTIAGRLVREIDVLRDPSSLASGILRIGWNQILWDGRDEDGDLVASGVYLYKVYVRADGTSLRVNNDSGVEKLVVLR